MAGLTVREPGRVPFSVPLPATELSIGREAANDLVLADNQASRKHARVFPAEGSWWVNDLGSTHGTLVNGVRADKARLVDGDVIQIGNVLLVFRGGDTASDQAIYRATTEVGSLGSLGSLAEPSPRRNDAEGRRLLLLYEISRAIGALADPDELIGRMLETALDLLDCQRGVVGLTDHQAKSPGRRIARTRKLPAGAPAELVVSRTLIEAIVVRKEALIVSAGQGDAPRSLVREGVCSAMGAPLIAGQRVLGFLYVDDRSRANHFTPSELDFLSALGHLAAAALDQAEQRRRDRNLAQSLREANPTEDLIGESEVMRRLKTQVRKFAATDAAVLLRGESGTGKELIAHRIHNLSPRAEGPFVAVNCAAIPDALFESELFGHEKGAFTGAIKTRRGKFALAHGGTLFLDEVGDLSLAAQAKLLRAIEEGEVLPLGADHPESVDVRIISATNRPLESEIAAGRFREDLLYRLNLGELEAPPLRERGADLELLADTFRRRAARRLGRDVSGFAAAALDILRRYPWPGNVRQLQNEVERAVILTEGQWIEVEDLRAVIVTAARLVAPPAPPPPLPLPSASITPPPLGPMMDIPPAGESLAHRFGQIDVTERGLVEEALRVAGGSVTKAARLLGISRIMLRRRAERFGLTEKSGEEKSEEKPGEGE